MNVCIVYELNNREFYNSVLLERELVRRGHTVRICHKTESVNLCKSYDITLVPNSYCNSDVDFYRYVFNTKNNPIVIYPYEQLINHNIPKLFDQSDSNIVKTLPHFCWGQDYFEWIKELGIKNVFNRITGAIQLDLYRPQFKELYLSREELADRFGLPIDKKWILFISDFVFTNESRVRHTVDAGAIDEEYAYKLKVFEEKTIGILAKWFENFLVENEDYVIIYRKHPTEIITDQIEKLKNNTHFRLFLISDLSINEWIANCDIITTWNSTAVVECYAANKKVALLRPFQFPSELKNHENELYYHYTAIKDYLRFKDCMLNEIPEYTEKFKIRINELYNISEERSSFIRVADALEFISDEYVRQPLESGYVLSRTKLLLKRGILIKVLIKNLIKVLMSFSASTPTFLQKKRLAVSEWSLSAKNAKMKKRLAQTIDEILLREYS